jgi:A/G-specific adenine glycosylase
MTRTRTLAQHEIDEFTDLVYTFYREHSRRLPWRETTDPYRILLSEIMLQQTQVERVLTKYESFLQAFPTVADLAQADLSEVLRLWSGLGYNRRALFLKRSAEEIVVRYAGKIPDSIGELQTLPGIGPYTAAAVCVFAFGRIAPLIETNIRRLYIHLFFTGHERVSDSEIMPLVDQTFDRQNPRQWVYALMDYGAHLKGSVVNPNRRSAHYTRQSRFEGSDRQVRGMILRALSARALSAGEFALELGKDVEVVARIAEQLADEGFIVGESGSGRYRIAR